MPQTAQLPYSHVKDSTRDELEGAGLVALKAMVDVEPYDRDGDGDDPSDSSSSTSTSGSSKSGDSSPVPTGK